MLPSLPHHHPIVPYPMQQLYCLIEAVEEEEVEEVVTELL